MQIEARKGGASLPWAHLRLPPFPQVAIRLLQLANDENVQLHHLSDLISSNPAFAAEVLTIANSLLYAPRIPVSSILQGIAVMGANELKEMCLTVGVRAFLGKSLSLPAMRDLWRHNLACALIAEQLASAGFLDKGIAYTSGVLHDIGRFALAVVRPKAYAACWRPIPAPQAAFLSASGSCWDGIIVTQGPASLSTGSSLRISKRLSRKHHSPRQINGAWGMSELIKVSCRMADTAGFRAFPGCEVTLYSNLLDELPPRERRLFDTDVESLVSTVAGKIQAAESI